MNFQLLNKQRKLVLAFSALGFIAMFLPWVSISILGSSQTVNGMHDKGIVIFLCFIAAGGLAVTGNQKEKISTGSWMFTMLLGAIALLLTLLFLSDASGSILGSSIIGFGSYLAAIAGAGIVLSAYLLKAPQTSLTDGFNSVVAGVQSLANRQGAQNTPAQTTAPQDPLTNLGDNEEITPVV